MQRSFFLFISSFLICSSVAARKQVVVVTSGGGVYSIEKTSENVVTRAKGGGDASRSLQTKGLFRRFRPLGSQPDCSFVLF